MSLLLSITNHFLRHGANIARQRDGNRSQYDAASSGSSENSVAFTLHSQNTLHYPNVYELKAHTGGLVSLSSVMLNRPNCWQDSGYVWEIKIKFSHEGVWENGQGTENFQVTATTEEVPFAVISISSVSTCV
jgi:hypothetical protein